MLWNGLLATRTQADVVTGCLVEVEGVVEYKSLPSGLHNVTEDLVYAWTSFPFACSLSLTGILV